MNTENEETLALYNNLVKQMESCLPPQARASAKTISNKLTDDIIIRTRSKNKGIEALATMTMMYMIQALLKATIEASENNEQTSN